VPNVVWSLYIQQQQLQLNWLALLTCNLRFNLFPFLLCLPSGSSTLSKFITVFRRTCSPCRSRSLFHRDRYPTPLPHRSISFCQNGKEVGNRKEHTGCVTQGSRAGVTSVYIIQCTVHGATAVLRMPSELVTSISGKRRRSQAPHLLSPSAFSLRFSQPILEKGEPNASCYSSVYLFLVP
jgi:hypothetical protein